MRKVDKLGRIVIPFELRRKYGLTEGVKIEFLDAGEGITVRSTEPFCRVCRARIFEGATLPLCEACIAKAVKNYNERKRRKGRVFCPFCFFLFMKVFAKLFSKSSSFFIAFLFYIWYNFLGVLSYFAGEGIVCRYRRLFLIE